MTWAVRLAAALLFYIALWIVLPPPTYPLLVLAVGAPEISPLLLVGACVVIGLIVMRRRTAPMEWPALVLAIVAGALALLPLTAIPGTVARFDRSMAAQLGDHYRCAADLQVRSRIRRAPISLIDLVTGLSIDPPVRLIRGIEFGRNQDGPLTLDLYQADSASLHPIVIQIYGGAWQRGQPGDDRQLATALAAAGYLVVAIDYRHAPRWQFPAQLDDVAAALGWVRHHAARYGGDSNAIALLGRSSGAQLALLAAYADSSAVKGVISFYGPVDLTEGYRHPPRPDPLDVRAIQRAYLGGTPGQMPERYRDASPLTHLRSALPPTLLVHGSRDQVVEPRFARMLRDSLLARGDTAVLLELPWAEHAFDAVPAGPGSQIALYEVEHFLAWLFATRGHRPRC